MPTTPAIAGDLSVFSIGGNSQLAYLRDASITLEVASMEASPIVRVYNRADAGRKSGRIRANLMSVVSGSVKTNHLDVSAFAFASNNLLGSLQSGSLSIEMALSDAAAVNDSWASPYITKKTLSGEAVLNAPAASSHTLAALFSGSAALSGLTGSLSFTINGVAVTADALFRSYEHSLPQSGFQTMNLRFEGAPVDATATAYPAAPTGTTTLLEKALNSLDALAFAITSKAAGGVAYSGNMVFSSYRVRWANGELVMAEMEFATQGAVTAAAPA